MSGTINFISAGAAQGLVRTVAEAADVKVAGSFGAVGAMQEKFLAGEPCDVVILSSAQMGELTGGGLVDASTTADLGSVPTAIAVREGDAALDVSTEGSLRAALLAADAIYFPDPEKATAGVHFAQVTRTLGIHDLVAARFRTHPNGAAAMAALAQAPGHPIGCTQATEIIATPGVRLVAPLPPGADLSTVYTAAVPRRAPSAAEAAAFIATLTSRDTASQRVAAGFVTPGTDH